MKKFKEFMSEMTMSYGVEPYLGIQDFSGAKHIGDIQSSRILYKQINGLDFYGITEDDNPDKSANFDPNKPVGWVQVQNQNIAGKDYLQIRNIFTEKEFRGQNYAKKILFFLRNVEKKSFVFGDRQSELGQALVKSVAKSKRFPMFWLNIETGEKHDYDATKDFPDVKPYRSWGGVTDWVVIAEGLEGRDFLSRFQGEMGVDPNYWNKYIQWF